MRVPRDAVVLRVSAETGATDSRVRCAECGLVQVSPAGERQAAALVEVGVPMEWWTRPEELDEPRPDQPITAAEVRDWKLFVHDDDGLAAAVAVLSDAAEGTT